MGYVEAFYPDGSQLIIKSDDVIATTWAHCDGCDKPTNLTELNKSVDSAGETLWWLCQKCSS